MTLPNFLVLGAQKSGTTSLYHYLKQHPQVYMSPVKEVHFFDNLGGQQKHDAPGRGPAARAANIEEYRAMFGGVSGEKAVGEVSPSYLYDTEVPARIRRHMPEARMIAILRNPADRAYSAYLHNVRQGCEPLSDFALALQEEESRIRRNWPHIYHYKNRGFYTVQLARYFSEFGRDRIGVYLYEDLRDDPLSVMGGIFRFLEVDEALVPNTSRRYNVSGVPRNRAARALFRLTRRFSPDVKALIPPAAHQRARAWMLAKPPPLDPELRRKLLEAYRTDIMKLQDLIGRDLSGWLK